MHRYIVFGLEVESALDLPAARLETHPYPRPADVTIRVCGYWEAHASGADATRSITASSSEVVLCWEDVGRYVIRGGRQIDIWPRRGAAERLLGLFVTGSAFAMLLYQRGITVLHGSVVEIAGQAVGFLGDKGAGKSTLAMGMQQRGGLLISDDLLALHAGPEFLALPGFRQMKLWPDTLRQLGLETEELEPLRPELEKRGMPIPAHLPQPPVPLHHLFVLQHSAQTRIMALNAKQALLALLPHWYPARFGTEVMQQLQAQPRQFAQCVALAQGTRVSLLGRPARLEALPDVAEALCAYLQTGAPQHAAAPQ